MITMRRAIPPIMSAREREVPVMGRSYSPALLGWCSAMHDSLTWNSRCLSGTLSAPDCSVCHPGFWISILESNCYARLCSFP
jgi:hypothetical protein